MNQHSENNRAAYATLEDTISALFLLSPAKHGVQVDAHSVNPLSGAFALNYVTEDGWGRVSGRIYACGLGYHCVVINDNVWRAPVVWKGPRAMLGTETNEDLVTQFAEFVREALRAR